MLRLAAIFTGARGVIGTETAYHGNAGLVTDVSPSLFMTNAPPQHVRLIPAPASSRVPRDELSGIVAGHVAAAIADLKSSGIGRDSREPQ